MLYIIIIIITWWLGDFTEVTIFTITVWHLYVIVGFWFCYYSFLITIKYDLLHPLYTSAFFSFQIRHPHLPALDGGCKSRKTTINWFIDFDLFFGVRWMASYCNTFATMLLPQVSNPVPLGTIYCFMKPTYTAEKRNGAAYLNITQSKWYHR